MLHGTPDYDNRSLAVVAHVLEVGVVFPHLECLSLLVDRLVPLAIPGSRGGAGQRGNVL